MEGARFEVALEGTAGRPNAHYSGVLCFHPCQAAQEARGQPLDATWIEFPSAHSGGTTSQSPMKEGPLVLSNRQGSKSQSLGGAGGCIC